jgi:hypothetical protein
LTSKGWKWYHLKCPTQKYPIVLPMCYPELKKPTLKSRLSLTVQAERLELSHLAALDPKSSVSTNSTTPAFANFIWLCKYKAIFEFKNGLAENFYYESKY